MVKLEHADNFSDDNRAEARSATAVAPRFPKTSPSAAAGVESSINQNATSKHNQFLHMQSAEQSPRRTSRKRSPPAFYKPPSPRQPAASPRSRDRPPKCQLMSPHQETQTRNTNEVSSTPSRSPKKKTPSLMSSSQANNRIVAQVTKMDQKTPDVFVYKKRDRTVKRSTFRQDIEETLVDITLTEASDPISGCERATKAGRKNMMSERIDSKILLQSITAREASFGGKSRSSDFGKNLTRTLKAINKKHGDITWDCSLESDWMKTILLLGICMVVQDLQKKQLEDLDISSLDSYYAIVRDAELVKVNVKWLHIRLDEIKDAVCLKDEAKDIANKMDTLLESIERKEKEVDRLKSEIEDIESQLAQEISEVSRFQHKYLMDGLS